MPKKQLICLSHTPWKPFPSRTQRLLSHLKDVEILFFEPAPERLDRDMGRQRDGERMDDSIRVYTLPATLPALLSEYRSERRINRKLGRFIDDCMRRHRFRRPVLWVDCPVYSCLTQVLDYQGLIYDCAQDWTDLPLLWESELTSRADVVFAASPGLAHHLSPCNDNIAVVPYGINYSFYSKDHHPDIPLPRELRGLPRPIFGYTGTIWDNLDLEPVETAARAHRDWTFVLIGRLERETLPSVRRLRQLPNVYFLGYRPRKFIPAYINHFDICFSLMRSGHEDDDVLSPRIYEYLATGKPIVSMYHHLHREEYPYLIESAYSAPRFVDACEKMLAQQDPAKQLKRREASQSADWELRCAKVEEILHCNGLLGSIPADKEFF